MSSQLSEADAAVELAGWALSDSRILLNRDELAWCLVRDVAANGGRRMTKEECMLFIIGDDEGEVPEELEKLFPETNRYICKKWG